MIPIVPTTPAHKRRCKRCRCPLTVLGSDSPRETCVRCPPSGMEALAQRERLTVAQAELRAMENLAQGFDTLFGEADAEEAKEATHG